MSRTFTDTVEIAADVDAVWALTVDVERLPDISPTFRSVRRLDDGPLAVGSQAEIRQPMQRPATWTVTTVDAPRRFVWETTAFGMTMVAAHDLEPVDGGCRNTLSVTVSGPAAPVLGRLLGPAIRRALRTENAGFAAAVG